jgi:4-hydroxymandelate oxidase
MPPSPVNVMEFEALARERMDPSAFDYYTGGAGDERTLAENRAAFARVWLRPRVLTGVSTVDLATTWLGERVAMPMGLAPTAFNRLSHPEGEAAAARAAGAMGLLMCSSTIASSTLEEVAEASTGPLWFQLYVYRDRDVTRDLVHRAEAAGYRALVLTVDTPRLGRRERDVRNRFTLPEGVSMRNLEKYFIVDAARWSATSSFTEYVHRMLDDSLTWESVSWLRSITRLPVLIKGILSAEDAALSVEHGAAGVIVSNHGGRQLDGAMATLDALPHVVEAVDSRGCVLLDGGVRRGVDILAALALGAQGVLIGRPYLWALAADGEAGVRAMLEIFRRELELAMALTGCATIAAVSRDLLAAARTRR